MGPNEAGKSTLCFTLNGLIPHLVKGSFEGRVSLNGKDTRLHTTRELFAEVGLVFQDFEAQLFSTLVELEVAFAPENLGLDRERIEERIGRSLELTGLNRLKGRQPATLSGGQKQLLAIASVLAIEPRILCLDEPTTDLDPMNKRRVFSLTRRLFKEGTKTFVIVEHETEEAVSADRIVLVREGQIVADGPPHKMLRDVQQLEQCSVMPLQLTRLFQRLGSTTLPLSLEEATDLWSKSGRSLSQDRHEKLRISDAERTKKYGGPVIEVRDAHFSYENNIDALRGIDLAIREGEFVAILGQNGSGKTTLAKHFNGLLTPASGSVLVGGLSASDMTAATLGKRVGYVFQNPDHQIFEESILDEVMFGPLNLGFAKELAERQARDALETVGLWERRMEDPFTLTKGLRQKVAVASVLATRPHAIVLDEPTTGLDYGELRQMMALVRQLNEAGHTVIIITHCVWVAAEYAHRIILMSEGRIVADGTVRDVFAREELLERADIIAPQIVRFSNGLGTTILSVEEFLQCV